MVPGKPAPRPKPLVGALKFLKAWLDKFTESAAPPPASLYHYTDAASLISIAKTQELWATNGVFMNDQTEVTHAANLLSRLLEEEDEAAASTNSGPDVAVRHLLQYVHNFVEIYVISFCADGDLLSQWRGYGASGGYAIEFSGNGLVALGPGRLRLVQVQYDEETQLGQLRELLHSWRSILASISSEELGWSKAAALLAQVFGVLAISFKNDAFAEEREWRLCYSRLRLPETSPTNPSPWTSVRGVISSFRSSDFCPNQTTRHANHPACPSQAFG
jgi:hypothetical protein